MIYLVSGVPRSFTTATIRAIDRGGIPAIRGPARDTFGRQLIRANYEPNPGGELWEPNLEDVQQLGFPREHDGHVIKVLATWLPCLAVHSYRAVFLLRDPEEVYRSMQEMLKGTRYNREFIAQEQREGQLWLQNRRDVVSTSVFSTDQLLRDPLWVFETLARDGWPIDAQLAADVIEPRQQRVRA